MKAVNPYLTFPGTAEAAFAHYRTIFGGEFTMVQRFGETPMAAQFPAGERDRIMHIALPLAHGAMLMGNDISDAPGQTATPGTSTAICLETDSEAETDRLFAGLAQGGSVEMAPQKVFWGAYYGACADRFGVRWMVHHTYPSAAQA